MARKANRGVSRRKWKDTPGGGIPRNQAEASAIGLEAIEYNSLSAAMKKRAIPISSADVRPGALALIIPPTRRKVTSGAKRKVTPGPRPGTFIVCYYNPVTGAPDFNCHILTADQLRAGFP